MSLRSFRLTQESQYDYLDMPADSLSHRIILISMHYDIDHILCSIQFEIVRKNENIAQLFFPLKKL